MISAWNPQTCLPRSAGFLHCNLDRLDAAWHLGQVPSKGHPSQTHHRFAIWCVTFQGPPSESDGHALE